MSTHDFCLPVAWWRLSNIPSISKNVAAQLPLTYMATAVKKLDLHVGELIEVAGRRYEAVPDREGNLILEPAITPMAELDAKWGTKPASAEDFERVTADFPSDGEG